MTLKRREGQQFGSYTILSLLGAGGMGEVYRARDTRLDREVAVKVLPEEWLADPDRRARFEREARLLAALNHPNIGAIYGVEDLQDSPALVMELVEGPTLADRLASGLLSTEEALEIARQIAAALEAAHERGIVHRDLKPANVKVPARGPVKLLDFGIATHEVSANSDTAAGTRLTAPGALVGTVDYMSPEQANGTPADPRSDQFSLGVILFEMLTGRHPFRRESMAETLAAILRDAPPTLAEGRPDVPAPLQWLVDRCLSRKPESRFTSTGDLAKDLATMHERLGRSPASTPALGAPTLPVPRTPLVGREHELAEAATLLRRDDVRLVTFTGPGGTGKTRLALQLAVDLAADFPGGVYFVSLAPISDPSLVASSLVQALGVRHGGNRDAAGILELALGAVDVPLLLILDNLEHVIDVAPLLTDLLEHCGHLKLLVTSRAMLRVYGEHDFEVPPLERPRAGRASLAELRRNPAVTLFLQRATAVRPDFALSEENAPALAEICRRLDGLPLAIELAAARVRMLTPKAMLQRLEKRFDLLTGGARDLPARQQTLHATVDWSHDLLSEAEQKLFRRLAVFVGGCTLESAEAVCDASEDLGVDVLDGMEALVGQSLVRQTEQGAGDPRFTMLETIRGYAGQRLAESGDEALARRAHAAYCLVLAEEAGSIRSPEERAAWLARCDLEHDNFRAALDWAIRTGEAAWGQRLAAALFPFWMAREYLREGRERLDAIMKLPAGPKGRRARANALWAAGSMAYEQGDYEPSDERHREALAIFRELGDVGGVISELNALAAGQLAVKNWAEAYELLEECAELGRQTGDEVATANALGNQALTRQEQGQLTDAYTLAEQALEIFDRLRQSDRAAWLQNRLGDIERERGDMAAAGEWYERARATFEALGDRECIARMRVDLAALAYDRGDEDEARRTLGQALTTFREIGNRRGIAQALDGFARLAAKRGDALRALRLAGAADATRHSIGLASREERLAHGRELDEMRRSVGPDAVEAEMAGWSMSVEDAVEEALGDAG